MARLAGKNPDEFMERKLWRVGSAIARNVTDSDSRQFDGERTIPMLLEAGYESVFAGLPRSERIQVPATFDTEPILGVGLLIHSASIGE
jgi:hypothetical protein